MQFTPENAAKILAGTKTQTRRAARKTDEWVQDMYGEPTFTVWRGGRIYWQMGRSYALQPGRGKHAVGRITITAIRYCSRASDISESDAIAEGFASADAFRETYTRINGAAAPERPCWALTFRLVPPASA